MSRIAIFYANSNRRSRLIGENMYEGAKKLGLNAKLLGSIQRHQAMDRDVAIFYGLADGLRNVFDHYKVKGRHAVYIDLGYWGRRKRTRYDGYHKVSVNDRHPTAYFQNVAHGPERFQHFGVDIQKWRRRGSHIVLAGMSAKAAYAEGFAPEEWERATVAELRKHTDRPIIYRPKPNWTGARPIVGTRMDCDTPLEKHLVNCHALVSHHSNACVDAVLAGVPVITCGGVASVMGTKALAKIEDPPMPDGREQWAADLGWVQWNVDEMREGKAFRYLLQEGLIT